MFPDLIPLMYHTIQWNSARIVQPVVNAVWVLFPSGANLLQ